MDAEHAKKMMDAFYEAKRIRDMLPPLPDGINPSYINILDAITILSKDSDSVRVSDIAEYRHLPLPGVTRTLKAMTDEGLIDKKTDENDHRVVHIQITKKGQTLHRKYVTEYFGQLCEKTSGISDRSVDQMIRTIDKIGKEFGL